MRINLKDIPLDWYNIKADLKDVPELLIHPGTKEPIKPSDLAPIFPKDLIEQELSFKRYFTIPQEVLDVYRLWRPTPLVRAVNLEKALKTPAKIYYKDESLSPSGSHKTNTAVAQAYYNKIAGITSIATETGAGQWGSALSFSCQHFGLKCLVYMVKVSYQQKPYRKILMQTWGAQVYPSPSDRTDSGRAVLRSEPNCSGSLGIAISEAVEEATKDKNTNYALGSVLNHVLLHQTVIGQEVKKQLKLIGVKPDIMIGCAGGGSNFAGLILPFVKDKLKGEDIDFIGVEPTACPTLTKGKYYLDHGDIAKLTPLLLMHSLGSHFMPEPIHAGGLRYHGMAPLISLLLKRKLIRAKAYAQEEVFKAGLLFTKCEGKLPAPETNHAIKAAIDEALKAKQQKREKTIIFNFSGHGFLDLAAYEKFLDK